MSSNTIIHACLGGAIWWVTARLKVTLWCRCLAAYRAKTCCSCPVWQVFVCVYIYNHVGWADCLNWNKDCYYYYYYYRLRSTGSAANYVLPRTRTKFGERGFFYSGPAAWNTLPSDLHDITDTSTSRKRLKNVLFDRDYCWCSWTSRI